MKFNRDQWTESIYTEKNPPNLICPTCYLGQLKFKKERLRIEESSETKLDDDPYKYQQREGHIEHFAWLAVCPRHQCQQSVIMAGYIKYKGEYDFDQGYHVYPKQWYPLFFYPPLHIIYLGKKTPTVVKEQLIKSFSLFFLDYSACANSMRTALELLMNSLKISKYEKGSKRKPMALHSRIIEFGKIHPHLAAYLIAAKWIGNAGSHSKSITRNNLLDGYGFFDYALDELFEKQHKQKELMRKARVINRTKKPLKD